MEPDPKFMFTNRNLSVIGVSVKEGQTLSGVELAPQLYRKGGLFKWLETLGWDISDLGDITKESLAARTEEVKKQPNDGYRFVLENTEIIGPVNEKLATICHEESKKERFVLILGGDHGLASGSITGIRRTHPNLKVIWFDAHGDCNTVDTTPSFNYHGMPAAHIFGWLKKEDVKYFDWIDVHVAPENFVYIGLRDIDPKEKQLLAKHKVKYYTPYDIENVGGVKFVMDEALQYLHAEKGQDNPIHVSWDVDGCDPAYIYGTGTKARVGLSERESHYILQRIAATGNLVSLDMVEVNPLLDIEKRRTHFHGDNEHIQGPPSICNAIELTASALGFTWR